MKKILFALLILLAVIPASARRYRAYEVAAKVNGEEWTDWNSCNIPVYLDTEKMVIYSKSAQVYTFKSDEEKYYDREGNENYPFICRDQDHKRCLVRFRIGEDTNQIY